MGKKSKNIIKDPIYLLCSKQEYQDVRNLIYSLEACVAGVGLAAMVDRNNDKYQINSDNFEMREFRQVLGSICHDLQTLIFSWKTVELPERDLTNVS